MRPMYLQPSEIIRLISPGRYHSNVTSCERSANSCRQLAQLKTTKDDIDTHVNWARLARRRAPGASRKRSIPCRSGTQAKSYPMQLDDAFRNGEAEPRTTLLSRDRIVGLLKLLK